VLSIDWLVEPSQLRALQEDLGVREPPAWVATAAPIVGASYCCGDDGHGGAAATLRGPDGDAVVVVAGPLHGDYRPGYLAAREGPLREAAVRRLDVLPDVLIVDAAGRDHPRRAGLALHLGAVVDVPTVGATDRPLAAQGEQPADRRGATSPLRIAGDVVGYWVRVVAGVRPLAVSAGWRVDPEQAVEVVLRDIGAHRTPQAVRLARCTAREARAAGVARPLGAQDR
jgi:deoxyribonuclease V